MRGETQQEVADEFNISFSRVSQIVKKCRGILQRKLIGNRGNGDTSQLSVPDAGVSSQPPAEASSADALARVSPDRMAPEAAETVFALNVSNLRNFVSDTLTSFSQPAESSTDKSLVLYADSILDDGCMVDLESTLKKMNGITVIVYGRKPGYVQLLQRIIHKASSSINVIAVEAQELQSASGFEDINIEHPNEARELDEIIDFANRRNFNNGKLLGVVKGKTDAAHVDKARDIAKERKVPVVSFETEEGAGSLYSFAAALGMLTQIKNASGPDNSTWFAGLKPIAKWSEEIKTAYDNYLRALEAMIAA